MRYFSFYSIDEVGSDRVEVVSEEDIRSSYWPYWCERLRKQGRLHPGLTFEDCLDDWVISNWAWEVNE